MGRSPEEIHGGSIVIDAHCDTIPLRVLSGDYTFGAMNDWGEVDLPRAAEAGVTAIFFAAYQGGVADALGVIDAFFGEVDANPDRLTLATCAEDIREAKRSGKLAGILALEGGHLIEGRLSALRMFYRLGVRVMGLTHRDRNRMAESCTDMPEGIGLTDFGVQAVREMNRLGMLVDLAHISPAGFADVLRCSTAAVICSHANAKAICGHPRNLDDGQMKALAGKGGVLGVSVVPHFINDERDAAGFSQFIDHIEYAVGIMGADHVGIGTDFDGFKGKSAEGLRDIRCLRNVAGALTERGFSETEVAGILGENFLRVIAEVLG